MHSVRYISQFVVSAVHVNDFSNTLWYSIQLEIGVWGCMYRTSARRIITMKQ